MCLFSDFIAAFFSFQLSIFMLGRGGWVNSEFGLPQVKKKQAARCPCPQAQPQTVAAIYGKRWLFTCWQCFTKETNDPINHSTHINAAICCHEKKAKSSNMISHNFSTELPCRFEVCAHAPTHTHKHEDITICSVTSQQHRPTCYSTTKTFLKRKPQLKGRLSMS